MPAAAAAILDGMPDARDLHRLDTGGQTMIFAGSVQLFQYAEDDTAKIIVWPPVPRRCRSRASGMPSKMAAAAAGMHPPYHDLTYYAKKYACVRRPQARRRRTGTGRARHRASRDAAGPDESRRPFSR